MECGHVRQIRSVCRLYPERHPGLQVPDEKEDSDARVEREFHCRCGEYIFNPRLSVLDGSSFVALKSRRSFTLEVFDWNRIEQDRSLGQGTIDIASINAFQAMEVVVQLHSRMYDTRGGVRLRLMFQPEIIVKSHKLPRRVTANVL